jgi:hypothetical protein
MFEKYERLLEEVFPELFTFDFVAIGPVKATQPLRAASDSGDSLPTSAEGPCAPDLFSCNDMMQPASDAAAMDDDSIPNDIPMDQQQQQQQQQQLFLSPADLLPAPGPDTAPFAPQPSESAYDVALDWMLDVPPAESTFWPATVCSDQQLHQHEEEKGQKDEQEEDEQDEQDEEDEGRDDATTTTSSRQHPHASKASALKLSSSRAPRVRKRMEDNIEVTLSSKKRVTLTEGQLSMTQQGLLRAVAAALATALSEQDKAILLHEQKRYRMRVSSRRRRDQRAVKEQALRAAIQRSQMELEAVMRLVEKCSAPHMSPAMLASFLASTRVAIAQECGLPANA